MDLGSIHLGMCLHSLYLALSDAQAALDSENQKRLISALHKTRDIASDVIEALEIEEQ